MEFVFVDTSVFEGNNFFEGVRIRQLLDLSSKGHVQLVLPRLTYDELKNRILKRLDKAFTVFEKSESDLMVIRNASSFEKRFSKLNNDEKIVIKNEAFNCLDNKLTTANCLIIDYPSHNIESVFLKYFTGEYPFHNPGKKHEFPDAFAMLTLENWCIEKKVRCYVISKDKDLTNYKSEYLETDVLGDFIDRNLRNIKINENNKFYENIEEKIRKTEAKFTKNRYIIEKNIITSIEEWVRESLESSDFDFIAAQVERIRVDFGQYSLINVGVDSMIVEWDIDTKLDLLVQYYDDIYRYMDDDKIRESHSRIITDKIAKDQSVSILAELSFEGNKDDAVEIVSLVINNGNDFNLDESVYQ